MTPMKLIVILMIAAMLAACTGSEPTPNVEQVSLSAPVPATVSKTPVIATATSPPAATPTATPVPPTSTPTPKPPSLEDVLLADARHVHGAEDAPVTFIEFSDFK